ncbi:Integrase [Methylomagnum ishizawai]|uniref:Integrase n=1 Tax=Methylomagnum ishizawai TaxID=1760988 RepID=A0A1Y6D1R1_9GAMM|nr:site-specific integrase [Methylomagnum ishizawai]SMF96526.1 Integrase [Methylomagnum ishizawai]
MGKLTDLEIKRRIEAGQAFEGLSDGDGLYLRWPKGPDGKPSYKKPIWRFRYKIDGKTRVMNIGAYGALGLADARKLIRELRARVALGFDPAMEKRQRKAENRAQAEIQSLVRTVSQLADEFFARYVDGKLKRPETIRQRLDLYVKRSLIGGLPVDQVKPLHIDQVLTGIVDTGKLRTANDILRWLKRIFDFGVTRHYLETNPAAAFGVRDAGGSEKSRERALSLGEVAALFEAMKASATFSPQNALAVRLLLALGVRKMELLGAPWEEFDLDSGVWYLPAMRAKNEKDIRIPLPPLAVDMLRELHVLACGSAFVFPRRGGVGRIDKPMAESTLNTALHSLPHGLEPFTVHDFRRTVRTQLAALNIPPHICERCLNHAIPGIAGVYDRFDYFEERKAALGAWAAVLAGLESGSKVVPIRGRKD